MAASSLSAQETSTTKPPKERKHTVSLAIGSLWRPRVKYEYKYNERISFGGYLSIYTSEYLSAGNNNDYYTGAMISPMARYYFRNNANGGWYGQVKLNIGYFKETWYRDRFWDNWDIENPDRYTDEGYYDGKKFASFGGGVAIGYQKFFKGSRWGMDANIGFGFSSSGNINDKNHWRKISAPGSIINTNLAVCYRF